jgi:hypothetical protein
MTGVKERHLPESDPCLDSFQPLDLHLFALLIIEWFIHLNRYAQVVSTLHAVSMRFLQDEDGSAGKTIGIKSRQRHTLWTLRSRHT